MPIARWRWWLGFVRDALAVGALGALAVALCAPALGRSFYFNDFGDYNLPVRAFFAAGWRQGELRWWCHELGGGFPLFAEGQGGAAYPPNLLFALLAPWRALTWSIITHLAWGGVGQYALLRRLRLRRAAAFCGGALFLLSAPVWCRALHLNFLHGLAWLPWWLWGLERLARGEARCCLLLAAMLALMLLAGHLHPPLLALLVGPPYLLARLIQLHRPRARDIAAAAAMVGGLAALLAAMVVVPRAALLLLPGVGLGGWCLAQFGGAPGRRALVAGLLLFGLAGLLAGLLAAVQLLPLAELRPHSLRAGGWTMAQRLDISLEPVQLLELIAPRQHGSPMIDDVGAKQRWGTSVHWEWCPHLGVWPLLLLLAAPFVGRRRERWIFCGIAAAALILAMGETFPFYGWLARLPVWQSVRAPARLLGLFSLGGAAAAAYALEALATEPPAGRRGRWLAAAGLGAALTIVLLAVQRLALAGVVDDERVAAAMRTAWLRAGLMAACSAGLIAGRRRAGRAWLVMAVVLSVADAFTGAWGYHVTREPSLDVPPPVITARDAGERIWADQDEPHPLAANRHLVIDGLSNVGIYSPLSLQRAQAVREAVRGELPDGLPGRRWLALWRVALISPRLAGLPDGELLPAGVERFPPVWVSPRWRTAGSFEEALALACHPAWRPEAETILERLHGPAPQRGELPEVLWSELGRHRTTVRVRARQPCAVVLGQAWYPGWEVRSGGPARPAEPANAALMGTVAPAGYTRVEFVFRPLSIRLGLFASLCGLAALTAGMLAGRRR